MKDLLLTAALAALLATPLAAQGTSEGPSGDTIGDTQAADHEEQVTDPESVSVHELDPEDLEGAPVFDNDGEEIGTVSEAQTDREAGRPFIIVEADDRQVELFDDQFFVFREGNGDEDGDEDDREDDEAADGYRIELVIGRETFDALPDYEGN